MSDIRINDRQRQFVALVAQGEAAKDAARLAGFADHRALMNNPLVKAAMVEALQAELTGGILPVCLSVIKQALTSDEISLDKRATLAKSLVEKTLAAPSENNQAISSTKQPHEMTRAELRSELEKLQNEAAERAKPAVIDGQVIDK